MQHEAGEHQGCDGCSFSYFAILILELGGPGLVRGVCQLLVGEESIVVVDVAVGIGYLITEVVGIDVGRLVELVQSDGELLGISDEADGMFCYL